jgi:uncharacterized repeat protein (TIGR01451 family)
VTPSILGSFELDGNTTTGVLGASGSTTTSHDWDQVFNHTSGALATAFITDKVNTNTDDIFTGGGSKDTQGIQNWLFTAARPQGKDDITHAYAAAYTDPGNGHLLLYAGLDRFDNSGDSTAGFWFFANNIGQNPNVTQNGGHPFTGQHQDGDILLVSDFTVGGSVSTIAVYRWTGNDATGHLVNITALGNPNTFAIVNSAPISVPWSYTNKAGQTQPQAGEFLEEGVDLTALGIQGCFSTFLAETRSSQSPTATLSDFALGAFPLCSMAATPFNGLSKFDTATNQGDLVTYPLTVTNTGGTGLFIQSVSDTLLGNIVVNHTLQAPTAPVTSITSSFNFSQPLAPGASLTIFVTRPVQQADADPTLDTVTFVGTDDLAGLSDPITASANNSVNLFQPSVTLTEAATPTTATQAGQVITYTFTVTNTSSPDSPNLVLDASNPNDSFTDTLLGNLEADAIFAATGGTSTTFASLAPGASFTFTETRAIQPGDPSPLTDTSAAAFTLDQSLGAFPNIIQASGSASVTLLTNLTIAKAVNGGTSDTVMPGQTISYTITVTNTGAGAATNVVLTDQLPEDANNQLVWSVTSSQFDTTPPIDSSEVLTATSASLAGGASESVTVSALVPLNFFGNVPNTLLPDGVPPGLFELDGNTTVDTAGGHDWNQVFSDFQGTTTNASGARAIDFVNDAINTTKDNIFTAGGSKDISGIQQGPWLWTSGKPQGKDDIENASAALYTERSTDPNPGDTILYAMVDRFDNSGDATMGFWFFANPIGLQSGKKNSFTGAHSTGFFDSNGEFHGDILVISDFSIGGSTSTPAIYGWLGG